MPPLPQAQQTTPSPTPSGGNTTNPTDTAHQPEGTGHREGAKAELAPEGGGPKKNHACPLVLAELLPATDGEDRCEYFFCGIILAPFFCPHATHCVHITYFLQDYTGPWINPRHQRRRATFTPRPASPEVIVIEDETDEGEPEIQLVRTTTARPQPTHPGTVCKEGLPEVSFFREKKERGGGGATSSYKSIHVIHIVFCRSWMWIGIPPSWPLHRHQSVGPQHNTSGLNTAGRQCPQWPHQPWPHHQRAWPHQPWPHHQRAWTNQPWPHHQRAWPHQPWPHHQRAWTHQPWPHHQRAWPHQPWPSHQPRPRHTCHRR